MNFYRFHLGLLRPISEYYITLGKSEKNYKKKIEIDIRHSGAYILIFKKDGM